MYRTLEYQDFLDAFRRYRLVEGSADEGGANFSLAGLWRLWEVLEDFEANTGEELRLDVVALCCAFAEHTEDEIMDELTYGGVRFEDPAAALADFIDDSDVHEIEGVVEGSRRFIVGEAADWDAVRKRYAV